MHVWFKDNTRDRHISISVHQDGSGSIGVYYAGKLRGEISLKQNDGWKLVNRLMDLSEQLAKEAKEKEQP